MIELRCDSGILHSIVKDGQVEVKCRSNRCGKEPGVVVLHRFDPNTGELLSTEKFQEPQEGS